MDYKPTKTKKIPWNKELKAKHKQLIELNSKIQCNEIEKQIQEKEKRTSRKSTNIISQMEENCKKQINHKCSSIIGSNNGKFNNNDVRQHYTKQKFHQIEQAQRRNYSAYRNIKD